METSDEDLDDRDVEDVAHHRYDHMHGMERHKIGTRQGSSLIIQGPVKSRDVKKMDKFMKAMYPEESSKEFDHTPHSLFVEMDELMENEWKEQVLEHI